MSALAEAATAEEARAFAATVAAIVARHAPVDPWQPGAAVSDADPALERALAEAGWDELATDERLLPLVAPAAVALGRSCASLAPVDRLLGGAVRAGAIARYAHEAGLIVEPRAGALHVAEALRAEPLPHTDSLGVARVVPGPVRAPPAHEARLRMAAWSAGSVGYLAGLAAGALQLALDHARSRRAFGAPLAALEPVQQLLADAATLADGLALLARDRPGLDALAHAGDAAERAVAICIQVTGALGFTLEFPLQRAHRRARAARSFADAVLLAWDERP